MFGFIPWDVWVAATIAAAVILVATFEPPAAALILVYLFLCAYVVVQVTSDEIV
jgi:hypothetical protein